MAKKYKIGLVIGRFQPFHKGHDFLIRESLKHCDKIIIGIGSANKINKKNPWTAHKRRMMLEEFVRKNSYEDRVLKIINLNDNPNDDTWYENLVKKTGSFEVTLGNNPWNNGIIKRHGKKVITIGFSNRDEWEGIQIRTLLKEKKPWEERVPDYLHPHVKKHLLK